jgi:hypothetical protein
MDFLYRFNDPVIITLDEVRRELQFTTRVNPSGEPIWILPVAHIISAANVSVRTIRPSSSLRRALNRCLFPDSAVGAAEAISSCQPKEEIWYVIRYCDDCFERSIGLYDSLESINFLRWDRRLQKLICQSRS